MLNPQQARSKFNNTLAILLAGLLWPLIGGVLMGVGTIMDMSPGLLGLTIGVIWLALIIWLIIQCWNLGPEVNVSSWAALWTLLPFAGPFLIGMFFLEPLKYIKDNKPANERLPLTWQLIKDAWNFNKQTWQTSIKTSAWYLYLALGLGISGILVSVMPIWSIVHMILAIIAMVVTIWIGVKLFLEVVSLIETKKLSGKENEQAKQYFGPYVWVAILTFLITAGPFIAIVIALIIASVGFVSPMLGGTGDEAITAIQALQSNIALLIGAGAFSAIMVIGSWIWMIYKSIQYTLAIPALLLQDKHGLEALRESARIVKRRWWGIFWKNQLWGLVIGGVVMLFIMIVTIVFMIPATIFGSNQSGSLIIDLLAQAAQGALQMFIMPLAFIFVVKLYKAFYKTAK